MPLNYIIRVPELDHSINIILIKKKKKESIKQAKNQFYYFSCRKQNKIPNENIDLMG